MIYYSKNGIVVRTATSADAFAIAASMRRQDVDEILAAGSDSPLSALADALEVSTLCLAAERDGVPVAMFGLVPDALLGSRARVWMLGADGLAAIKKSFVRISRLVIRKFLELYPELYNWVDCRYTGAIRWLESCGAVFGPALAAGVNGEPFKPFVLRRS